MEYQQYGGGFSFYEYLRYFMPGLIFSSIIFIIKYNEITSSDIILIFTISIVLGFIIRAFEPAKYIPGIRKLFREYSFRLINATIQEHCDNKLPLSLKFYIALDISYLAMSDREYSTIRNRFALAVMELDIAFYILLVIIVLIIKTLITYNIYYIFIISLLLFLSFILIDNGKNDLIRAYNLMLIVINKNLEMIELYKNNISCENILIYKKIRFI